MADNVERDLKPSAIDPTNEMGVLSDEQCIELLKTTPLGRLGFLADDAPLVLPVNYAWDDHSVVFRTLEGLKLAAAAEGQRVCFEVDGWDPKARTGWSVLVAGQAREVTDWAEQEALEQLGLVSWSRAKWRPIWIRVEPTEITGRVLR